jgi:hypothetical protein
MGVSIQKARFLDEDKDENELAISEVKLEGKNPNDGKIIN